MKTNEITDSLRSVSRFRGFYDKEQRQGVLGVFIHQIYFMVMTDNPRKEVNRQKEMLEKNIHPSRQLQEMYETYKKAPNALKFHMLSICPEDKVEESFRFLIYKSKDRFRYRCCNLEHEYPRLSGNQILSFRHDQFGCLVCPAPYLAKEYGVSRKSISRMKKILLSGGTPTPEKNGWVLEEIL